MTLERLDASSTLGALVGKAAWGGELPHLDGLVQTATDEVLSIRRESHTIDAILVPIWPLEALNEISVSDIPDAHALVQGACGDILGIGRNSDSRDTILNREGEDARSCFDIPESDSTVPAARGNGPSVPCEVERVDVLLVTRKGVANGP